MAEDLLRVCVGLHPVMERRRFWGRCAGCPGLLEISVLTRDGGLLQQTVFERDVERARLRSAKHVVDMVDSVVSEFERKALMAGARW